MNHDTESAQTRGPGPAWTYYEGTADNCADARLDFRYYTQPIGDEVAAGLVASVMFSIDAKASKVWPYLKDLNLWQPNHYYSGVLGDLEGKTFHLSGKPNDLGPHQYKVLKVIPEHLIVVDQPGPWNGGPKPYDGFSAFMLNEHGGQSFVNIVMQHAIRSRGKTDEEALRFWRDMESKLVGKWRDEFIPALKQLVYENNDS